MAVVNSELRARIGADTSGYRRGMAEVGRIAAGTAAGVAASFASVLSARAIAGQLRDVAAYGEALEDAAARADLTIETLQRLTLAATLTGGSMDSIAGAMKFSAKAMFDAKQGGKEATETFKALGLSAEALGRMNSGDRFTTIAKALASVASQSDRTGLALRVFGRGANDLLPMLANGSAGFAALTAEADRLGLVTERGVAAAGKFGDAMDRLQFASRGAKSALATEAMEALAVVIDDTAARIAALQRSGDLQRWGAEIADAITTAASALSTIGGVIRDHGTEIKALLATWAGWRVWTLAAAAVVGVGNSLAKLGRAMATDTALTVANTAAQSANAAARTAAAAQAQAAAVGIARASKLTASAGVGRAAAPAISEGFGASAVGVAKATAATGALAAGTATAAGSVGKLGNALAGIKFASYAALAFETAKAIYDLAGAIGEVGKAQQAAGVTDARPAWLRALDYVPQWMGGGPRDGETWRTEALGDVKGLGAAAPGTADAKDAAREEATRKAAEAAAKRQAEWWAGLGKMLDGLRSEARKAALTGDQAALDLYHEVTEGADAAAPVTAATIAAMQRYLEALIPGDPEAAIAVVRQRATERWGRVREAATELGRLQRAALDDQRRAVTDALAERKRIAAQIADAEDRQERAERQDRQRRRADRYDRRAEQLRESAGQTIATATATTGERRAARREERREAREQRSVTRRLNAAATRDRQGLSVSRRGRELLTAYRQQQAAGGARRSAKMLRERAEKSATAAAMEPLRQAMAAVNATLNARLPKDQP